MSDQIDPAFKAAYRKTQGQPVDAKPRAWDGYAHAVASSSELAGTEWETNDQPVGAVARRPIVAAQQDGGLVERLKAFAANALIDEAATAIAEKDARIAELRDLVDRLKLEAQIHAGEARGANATIHEAYQAVTEGRGEPGNWNGAVPIKEELDRLRNELTASRAEYEGLRAALGDAAEALSDCLDMLARFTHSTSNDLNHVEARAVYRAGREALVAAIGAGGQAVAVDRQRIDDALVSCAGLLRTLCKDEIGDTAAAELEYVRSIISNPPAQPGWRMVPEEPTEEMRDDAWNALNSRGLRHFGMSDILAIWKAMLTAAPLPGGAK